MLRKSISSFSKIKALLIRALNTPPFSNVGACLYQLAARVVLNIVKHPGIKVWMRNSYVTGNLIYGQSDIDFTIFINDVGHTIDEGIFLKRFSYAKKLFPFLGEVNIYKASQLCLIQPLLNPLEVARDPRLKSQLGVVRAPTESERFTYLFRMFLSDLKNLQNNPESRYKKWNYHFDTLGLDKSKKGELLRERILNELSALADNEIRKDIEGLLELPFIINNSLLDSRLIIFAPQLWHLYFRGSSNFHECISILNEASFREQAFFFDQLRWELFGLITQLPSLEDKFFQYHYHLPFLIETLKNLVCSHINEEARNCLLDGFIEVRRLLENDFSSFSKPRESVRFALQASAP